MAAKQMVLQMVVVKQMQLQMMTTVQNPCHKNVYIKF